MSSDILIVDDETDIRELVSGILDDEGYRTRTASNSDSALQEISARRPALIFLDIWLQGSTLDGMELLAKIKKQHPDLPIVMISGHGNIDTAVMAIKNGAYDFIEKPFKADRLILVAAQALDAARLQREVQELRKKSDLDAPLIGNSAAMSQLRGAIEKVARTNARVLISGAHGSGKELVARTLHLLSARRDASFIVLNSAAMEPWRMETELFGTEPGTGVEQQVGALELAHGGTLYIDEIADMPLATQAKIMRILLEQTFYREGGHNPVTVDVRIISSSSRDLDMEIQEGRLRADLFHRLSVVPIRVPTLAERRDDIPHLVHYFIKQISQATGLPRPEIGEDIMAIIQSHEWPGNVRQLRNNVERMMILANDMPQGRLTSESLPAEIGSTLPPSPKGIGVERLMAMPLREAREIFEREYLSAQINRFSGNVSKTAEFVGMERSALHRKLKSLGFGAQKKSANDD